MNAYTEPIVTQDLDIVVATPDLERARDLLATQFRVQEFPHSLSVYDPGSRLQVQVQLDERGELALDTVVEHVAEREVLDLARLCDAFPDLWDDVPESLRPRVAELRDS